MCRYAQKQATGRKETYWRTDQRIISTNHPFRNLRHLADYENEVSGLKEIYINIIKTVILAVRGFQSENLQTKASALTYSTLLSIVPLLAVLLGIAKGFGFQGTVRQELFDYFPGHEM